jgi:Flp pilus assembly pilin Flp
MNVGGKVRIERCVQQFWYSDEGQDLIEYTLIVALMVLTIFGLLGIFGPNIKTIWTYSNSNLSTAGSIANAGS